MIIESQRYGQLEVDQDRILHIKGGLLGFPNFSKFILVDDKEDPTLPFKWLISLDDPEYGFLVTDPGIFFKDYIFDLNEDQRKALSLQSEDDVSVITLLTIPSDPKMITANLRGPIVVNVRTLQGVQLVLSETNYATKHYIFLEATGQASAQDFEANEAIEKSFAALGQQMDQAFADTEVKRES